MSHLTLRSSGVIFLWVTMLSLIANATLTAPTALSAISAASATAVYAIDNDLKQLASRSDVRSPEARSTLSTFTGACGT
jgi:hypothetical protein